MNVLSLLSPLAQAAAGAPGGMALELPSGAWAVVAVYFVLIALGLAVDAVLVAVWAGWPQRWQRHAEQIPLRPWTRKEAAPLLALLLVFYVSGGLLRPAARALSGEPLDETTAWVVTQGLLLHLVGLGFVAYTLLRRRLSWAEAFGLERRGWPKYAALGVAFYLAAIPFLAFYSMLYQFFLRSLGFEILPQDVAVVFAKEPSFWMRLYFLSLAVVVAPVFEEVLFRGIGLPLLARKIGLMPAVFAVSAIFALVHFHMASLLPLFVIAVAFSLGYIYSGSLAVPIVMHAVFNTVNLALLMVLREV